jgi:hypothetical protein
MQAMKIIGAVALLAIVSTAALGFQEQQAGSPAAKAPGSGAQSAQPSSSALSGQTAPNPGVATGAEVRIPGLG